MDSVYGLLLVAAVLAGIAFAASRLLGKSERNAGSGGYDAGSGGGDF